MTIGVVHMGPDHGGRHSHRYVPLSSTHVPPFRHVSASQNMRALEKQRKRQRFFIQESFPIQNDLTTCSCGRSWYWCSHCQSCRCCCRGCYRTKEGFTSITRIQCGTVTVWSIAIHSTHTTRQTVSSIAGC